MSNNHPTKNISPVQRIIVISAWLIWLVVLIASEFVLVERGPYPPNWTQDWANEARFALGSLFLIYFISIFIIRDQYFNYCFNASGIKNFGIKLIFLLSWSGFITLIWSIFVVMFKYVLRVMPTTSIEINTFVGGYLGVLIFIIFPCILLSTLFIYIYNAYTKYTHRK